MDESCSKPGCKFCDKKDLPVLPVRYAVARAGSEAPELDAPFASQDFPAQLGGGAKYTLRQLRSGYLYVWDEKCQLLDAYFVTPDAYLYHYHRQDLRRPLSAPGLNHAPAFVCSRTAGGLLASCVTVPEPERATVVWFGFSDVEWTPDVIEAHKSAAQRERSMRRFDVARWWASRQHDHCCEIAEVDQRVAEYALEATAGTPAFEFATQGFVPRKDTAGPLKKKAHALAPGRGLMLAVMDPCGITQDLARLMQYEVQTFLTRPEDARPLAVSQAIMSLRTAVQKQALEEERNAAQQRRQQQYAHESVGFVLDDVLDVFDDRDRADQRRRRIDNAFELDEAGERHVREIAWAAQYGTKYSEPAREKFQTRWDADFAALDHRVVEPLARAHCAWLTGHALANYFEGHFSVTDAASGFAYQQVFTLCIQDCSDKLACLNQLQAWVKGQVADRKNLFLRALTLNNDALAAKVAAAADSKLSLDDMPWDALSDTLKEAVLATPRLHGDFATRMGRASALAPLLTNAGAGLIKALSAPDSAGMRWATQALLLMGVGSGRKIVRLQLSGSRKEFRAMILGALMNAQAERAGSLNADRMKGAINREVGRLEANGKLNGRQTGEWYLLLDEQQLAEAKLDDVRRAALDKRLAQVVVSPEAVERLTRRNVARALSSEVRWGAVALVLQLVSLNRAIEDNESAMAHERPESRYKLAAAAAAAAGTLTELVAEAVKGKGWGRVPVMRGTVMKPLRIARWQLLSVVGKAVGAVAGIVVAVFDYCQGQDQRAKGNHGLAALYYTSAGIGFFLAIALGFGLLSGPLGVLVACVLVGLLLFFTALIETLDSKKLQDWLERCYFGTDFRTLGYSSLEIEVSELRQALK